MQGFGIYLTYSTKDCCIMLIQRSVGGWGWGLNIGTLLVILSPSFTNCYWYIDLSVTSNDSVLETSKGDLFCEVQHSCNTVSGWQNINCHIFLERDRRDLFGDMDGKCVCVCVVSPKIHHQKCVQTSRTILSDFAASIPPPHFSINPRLLFQGWVIKI